MSAITVSFNGNILNTVPGVDLYNHEFNNLPTREIKINKVARRDLSIITSSEYSQKEITVWLEVCSGTRADTEAAMIFLKSLLQQQNAALVVSQGGIDTEYTATMNEFNITWEGTRALATIVFIASDPIGRQDTTITMASLIGITTSTSSQSATIQGSSLAYPIISVTIAAVTGGTNASITISNGLTNQGMTITRTWTPGDAVLINSTSLIATVNGSIVDFTGMFPQFGPGSQILEYSDSFTTRTVDVTATYQPRVV